MTSTARISFAPTAPGARLEVVWLNGAPAIRIERDGKLDSAVSLSVERGQITAIYAIRNPHKLARLGEVVRLSRVSLS